MINPAFRPALQQVYNRLRNVARVGRAAALIGDNPQHIAIFRQPQHRLDKVIAVFAKYPRRTDDNRLRMRAGDRNFPVKLGFTVNPQRVGHIRLAVGRLRLTVENIIGRNVDQTTPRLCRGLCQVFRALFVDARRQFVLGFRLVNGGIRRRIHNRVGPVVGDHLLHPGQIGNVQAVAVGGQNGPPCRQAIAKTAAQLPFRTG
ncbi:Uncharacterised protein [Serratia entomophila]|nr:Uncharacterised protein [Serratia entomophila]